MAPSDDDRKPEHELGLAQRYDEEEFPQEKRPVIRALNKFEAALRDGTIPRGIACAVGPDFAMRRIVLCIATDNAEFRYAVAQVLEPEEYTIETRPVFGRISD